MKDLLTSRIAFTPESGDEITLEDSMNSCTKTPSNIFREGESRSNRFGPRRLFAKSAPAGIKKKRNARPGMTKSEVSHVSPDEWIIENNVETPTTEMNTTAIKMSSSSDDELVIVEMSENEENENTQIDNVEPKTCVLKKEYDDLLERCKNLERAYNRANQSHLRYKQMTNELRITLKKRSGQMNKLKESAENSTLHEQELKTISTELTEDLKKREADLQKFAEQINELQTANENLRKKLDDMQRIEDICQQKLEQQNEECHNLRVENEKLKSMNDKISEKYVQSKAVNQSLKDEYESSLEIFKAECSGLRDILTEKDNQLKDINTRLKMAESLKRNALNLEQSFNNMQTEKDEKIKNLNKQLAEYKEMLDERNIEIDQISGRLYNEKENSAKILHTKASQDAIDRLSSENADLNIKLSLYEAQRSKWDALNETVMFYRDQIGTMIKLNSELKEQLEERENFIKDFLVSHEEEVKSLMNKTTELVKKDIEMEKEKHELKAIIEKMDIRRNISEANIETEIEAAKDVLSKKLKEQYESQISRITSKYEEELQCLQITNEKLSKDIDDMRNERCRDMNIDRIIDSVNHRYVVKDKQLQQELSASVSNISIMCMTELEEEKKKLNDEIEVMRERYDREFARIEKEYELAIEDLNSKHSRDIDLQKQTMRSEMKEKEDILVKKYENKINEINKLNSKLVDQTKEEFKELKSRYDKLVNIYRLENEDIFGNVKKEISKIENKNTKDLQQMHEELNHNYNHQIEAATNQIQKELSRAQMKIASMENKLQKYGEMEEEIRKMRQEHIEIEEREWMNRISYEKELHKLKIEVEKKKFTYENPNTSDIERMIENFNQNISEKSSHIEKIIKSWKESLADKNAQIDMEKQLINITYERDILKDELSCLEEYKKKYHAIRHSYRELETEIGALNDQLASISKDRDMRLEAKDKEIERLNRALVDEQDVYKSRSNSTNDKIVELLDKLCATHMRLREANLELEYINACEEESFDESLNKLKATLTQRVKELEDEKRYELEIYYKNAKVANTLWRVKKVKEMEIYMLFEKYFQQCCMSIQALEWSYPIVYLQPHKRKREKHTWFHNMTKRIHRKLDLLQNKVNEPKKAVDFEMEYNRSTKDHQANIAKHVSRIKQLEFEIARLKDIIEGLKKVGEESEERINELTEQMSLMGNRYKDEIVITHRNIEFSDINDVGLSRERNKELESRVESQRQHLIELMRLLKVTEQEKNDNLKSFRNSISNLQADIKVKDDRIRQYKLICERRDRYIREFRRYIRRISEEYNLPSSPCISISSQDVFPSEEINDEECKIMEANVADEETMADESDDKEIAEEDSVHEANHSTSFFRLLFGHQKNNETRKRESSTIKSIAKSLAESFSTQGKRNRWSMT